jgi:hypothetical protein
MKEIDLYPPIKTWLQERLFTVYPEVSFVHRTVDVIGIGAEIVVGIEMKLCLSRKLLTQASILPLACHRAYVAVASKPRSIEYARTMGIGVLRIVGTNVEMLLESKEHEPHEYREKRLRNLCSRMSTEGMGGAPCLDGIGPAQDCKRRVDEYRKTNSKASWVNVYENVPNHYANAKSMANALTTGLARRAFFKRLRKEKKVKK